MKAITWIQTNKFSIAVTIILGMAALCLYFFFQGLKKDHSLELVKQQIQLKEEARKQIIEVRNQWQAIADQQGRTIMALQVRDSVLTAMAAANNNYIQKISNKEYAKGKIQSVDNYSDTDLRQYIISLPAVPEPNDY